MVELFIIWVLFGVVASAVAGQRGGNGCGWFALGMLLGPFALILAFTVGKQCPSCASYVPKEANICPKCKASFVTDSANAEIAQASMAAVSGGAPSDAPDNRERRKCPTCAELILKEAKKCRFCGESVQPDVENQ